jgi:hypothetical protein
MEVAWIPRPNPTSHWQRQFGMPKGKRHGLGVYFIPLMQVASWPLCFKKKKEKKANGMHGAQYALPITSSSSCSVKPQGGIVCPLWQVDVQSSPA